MKLLRNLCLSTVCAALLTGCAGAQLSVDSFANATTAGLEAADRLALAQPKPDLAASQCYEGMIPVVASAEATIDQAGATIPATNDPILLFQEGRDGVKAGLGSPALLAGYVDAFNQHCGWLKADVEKDVVTIGLRLAPIGIKF